MLQEDYDSSVENALERAIEKAGRELCDSNLQNIKCLSHQETCQTNLAVCCTWLSRGKYIKCSWNTILTIPCENNSEIIMK